MSDTDQEKARRVGEDLVLPMDLAGEQSERVTRRLLAGVIVFVAAALTILATAPVREVALAAGEIKPIGDIADIRHVEGGEVAEVVASSGRIVEAGEALIRLRSVAARAELDRLRRRAAHLSLQSARLQASIDEEPFESALDAAAQARIAADPELRAAYDVERRAHAAAVGAQEAGRAAVDARRAQRRAELSARRAEAGGLRAELASFDVRIEIQSGLTASGAGTRRALLELEAERAQVESRLARVEGEAATTLSALALLDREEAQTAAARRAEFALELAGVRAEASDVATRTAALEDQVARLTIRAPVAGVVLDFAGLSPGDVLAPGGLAARVVPEPARLVAEVRVSPDDVGHVSIGDEAVVRVTTFDAAGFGEIVGRVRQLSPAAFVDERTGETFFTAELGLDRVAGGGGGDMLRLTPGMTAEAEIRTGAKSILRYMLKPVVAALDVAFSER